MHKKIQIVIIACAFFLFGFVFCLYGFMNFSVRQGELGCKELCEVSFPQTTTIEFYNIDSVGAIYAYTSMTLSEIAERNTTVKQLMKEYGYGAYRQLEPINCERRCTSRPNA